MHSYFSKRTHRSGFTLVELLVSVGIITILTVASITGTTMVSRRAANTKTLDEMNKLGDAIELARLQNGTPLTNISKTNCTLCSCMSPPAPTVQQALDNKSSQCWDDYKRTIDRVNAVAGNVIQGYPTDAWGSPFLIDELEGTDCLPGICSLVDTNGDGVFCYPDVIRSAGPNKDIDGIDDIVVYLSTGCIPD